jgi:WD40 repeat protein
MNVNAAMKLLALGVLIWGNFAEPCCAQTSLETNAPVFKIVRLFDLKKNGAYVFTFCPTSRELFVSFDEESSQIVYRWNVDTGRKLDSYKFPKKYRCDQAVVSPDGKVLVLVAYDMLHDALHKADKVRLIDVRSGKVIKELIYDGTPARVQFSRDGKSIVTRKYTHDKGGELVYDINGNEQKFFDLKAFDPIEAPVVWEIQNSKRGPRPGIFCRDSQGMQQRLYPDADTYWSDVGGYVISADNRYVACSTDKGKLKIWRISDANLVFDSQVWERSFPVSCDSKTGRFLFANADFDKLTWLQAVQLPNPN